MSKRREAPPLFLDAYIAPEVKTCLGKIGISYVAKGGFQYVTAILIGSLAMEIRNITNDRKIRPVGYVYRCNPKKAQLLQVRTTTRAFPFIDWFCNWSKNFPDVLIGCYLHFCLQHIAPSATTINPDDCKLWARYFLEDNPKWTF